MELTQHCHGQDDFRGGHADVWPNTGEATICLGIRRPKSRGGLWALTVTLTYDEARRLAVLLLSTVDLAPNYHAGLAGGNEERGE